MILLFEHDKSVDGFSLKDAFKESVFLGELLLLFPLNLFSNALNDLVFEDRLLFGNCIRDRISKNLVFDLIRLQVRGNELLANGLNDDLFEIIIIIALLAFNSSVKLLVSIFIIIFIVNFLSLS